MFFKLGVLKNFVIFTEKTPVLESLFDKVAGLNASNTKRTPTQAFSCEYWEIFQRSSFYRVPPVAASRCLIIVLCVFMLGRVFVGVYWGGCLLKVSGCLRFSFI